MKSSKPLLVALLVLGAPMVPLGLAAPARHVLDWRVIGSGTVGATDTCRAGFAAGCILDSAGSALGTQVGKSKYTLIVTAGPVPVTNNAGGNCVAADGTGTVTAANGAVINFNTVGLLCEEGAAGTPLHYNGTYRITPGTGRFLNAVGGGSVVATFELGSVEPPVAALDFFKIDGVK